MSTTGNLLFPESDDDGWVSSIIKALPDPPKSKTPESETIEDPVAIEAEARFSELAAKTAEQEAISAAGWSAEALIPTSPRPTPEDGLSKAALDALDAVVDRETLKDTGLSGTDDPVALEAASAFAQAAAELRTSFVAAFNASKVDMPDGTLFWPKALTGSPATPYDPLTATRLGSYWNLSIGSALRSGIFDPRGDTMRRTVDYMLLHGAFFLGLTRFNYYPVPVGEVRDGGLPGYNTTGADNVYGLGINEAMMEQDRADRIVLGLYGKLAHGMTRGTFISGEGDAFGPVPGEYHRSLYLPPSNTNNALFLKTLHDMLVFNHIGAEGKPEELLLAHATPRAWLADGKEIQVERAPTLFGPVSFHLRSQLAAGRIDATVTVPARRAPRRLALRLRTPQGHSITNVTVNGREHERFDPVSGTIDLTGLAGSLEIRANY